MPIIQHLPGSSEAILVEPDRTNGAPVDSDGDGELSDRDLEEVLGGLERIHFPDPIDLPASET